MIALENISFSYSPSQPPVINGLTLTIEPGLWVAVTGPDGAGKTTTGRLIKGLLEPDSGQVRIEGTDGTDGRESVGYLGGDPYDSMVGLSVVEDVAFGLENKALPQAEMRESVERALRWVGLCGMEQRLVHTLSGGEQQKVALAGALALGTRTLILDDALSMMDKPARAGLRLLLSRLRSELGLTVIESTHNFDEILSTDRVVFLSHGKILFDGSPGEFVASRLGGDWFSGRGGLAGLMSELEKRGVKWEKAYRALRNLMNRTVITEAKGTISRK
jgi:energy-coupling factor transport system ATP-binding protein